MTFATGSVWEMATNWVRNAQRAGVAEVLIGALDQQMLDMCDVRVRVRVRVTLTLTLTLTLT